MDDCHTFQLASEPGQPSLFARHWPATGPRATIALVHGFGEHSGRYGPMGAHLADNGVQVIACDLRGHGRSPGERGVVSGPNDYQTDVRALLTRAQSIHEAGPLVLMGHSMGGGIVLDYAMDHGPGELDGVIASAPLIRPVDPVPPILRKVVPWIAKLRPTASMANSISGDQISTIPAEQTEYEADTLNHDRLGLKTASVILEAGERLERRAADWPIALPLLVMHAEGDQLTQFEASRAFADAAPGADFMPFAGVQHEMHNDTSRGRIYRAVLDFIGDLR